MDQLSQSLSLVCPRPELSLRFGQEEDIDTYLDLQQKAYRGYIAWRYRDFKNDWDMNPHGVYLILEERDSNGIKRPIGVVTGRFKSYGAHISHLMVDPEYQGQDHGKFLLGKWIEGVRLFGLPKISLEVRASNQRAQDLYFQSGFIKDHVKRAYYSDNREDAWGMVYYL